MDGIGAADGDRHCSAYGEFEGGIFSSILRQHAMCPSRELGPILTLKIYATVHHIMLASAVLYVLHYIRALSCRQASEYACKKEAGENDKSKDIAVIAFELDLHKNIAREMIPDAKE